MQQIVPEIPKSILSGIPLPVGVVIIKEHADLLTAGRIYILREEVGNPADVLLVARARLRVRLALWGLYRIFSRPPGGVGVRSKAMHEDDAAIKLHVSKCLQRHCRYDLTLDHSGQAVSRSQNHPQERRQTRILGLHQLASEMESPL